MFRSLGHERLDVAGSVGSPSTPTVPADAQYADLSVSVADVRYKHDGQTPAGTAGLLLPAGTTRVRFDGDLSKLKFIGATGSAAVVDIDYLA